ncbi:sugar transferase [Rhodococcus erythropolis]|jgi:exopolysaccharide biosynthesis polyprenyl glycosylphosphotransferase|uniref:sugar transferase n=1 Tax=Rhodococcus TaxID=1827 RepID=UPI000F5B6DED|nr:MULTISPECIES: sugar transferase [Rhodococcus]MBJ7480092.1 sugar transferase [Rhodococcus sp. (in: high G+C Gram-positive bacteria)]MDI9957813.1 sugar transferase [Rhodococcus sp. IEGM 1237]MDI9963268.1 sugar transferase [Rhodococcus sp. IEGM 1251]MDV8124835.1 sugar transferase [Rhodococcus sp. IEGM 1304]RQO48927.1 polyprenyl glycosylphosphotransferase [Rhodococcus sp. KBW08]
MSALDMPMAPSLGYQRPRIVPDSRAEFSSRAAWQQRYIRALTVTDSLIVIGAVSAAQWLRFGAAPTAVDARELGQFSYTGLSVGVVVAWLATLQIFRTRSASVIGSGPEEYRRILVSAMRLFGVIAIVSLLLRLDIARLYLAFAFPVGLLALLVSRWLWRGVIVRRRTRGECLTSVLVVGSKDAGAELARNFERGSADGFRVVGVCVPGFLRRADESIAVDGRDIPLLGGETSVVEALELVGADTVAVTATEHLGSDGIRALAWDLESRDVDLVVAPSIVDVSGPRLSMRPVAGQPLIRVERPKYHGAQRFAKSSFDVIFASLILVAIAPVLLVAAMAVKISSPGPVLYRAERMGLDGKPFPMLKFRSMVQNADSQVSSLMAQNDGAGVLFKMRDDPRVTPVGRFLRRYSIDELPQFVNVLRREMSVVGPRPPLRREVEAYDGTVSRRLLVKPGITGLWQVSGRSDLSWEETVRLDLSYVDNWSLMGDVLIVGKTLKAVLASDGAY